MGTWLTVRLAGMPGSGPRHGAAAPLQIKFCAATPTVQPARILR